MEFLITSVIVGAKKVFTFFVVYILSQNMVIFTVQGLTKNQVEEIE